MKILRKLGFNPLEDGGDVRSAVRELARLKGLKPEDLKVPEVSILSLSVGITDALVNEFNARQVPWIYRARSLYVGRAEDTDVSIIWASPGAPLAAMVMEHLIACGTKYVIGVGLTASIDPNVKVGTIVIPTEAIRGEGTSYYYLPEGVDSKPDNRVINALRRACRELGAGCVEGRIYTTDAIHRETEGLIQSLRGMGVMGIDMESSAIFAVGTRRKVKAGCILAVSADPSIRSIGFYSIKLGKPIQTMVKIVHEAVKHLRR